MNQLSSLGFTNETFASIPGYSAADARCCRGDILQKLWSGAGYGAFTATDLQNAQHPANEYMIKLKSSFAGVMEAVCDWEKQPSKQRKAGLMSSISGSVSASRIQAAELGTFVNDYEQFRCAGCPAPNSPTGGVCYPTRPFRFLSDPPHASLERR